MSSSHRFRRDLLFVDERQRILGREPARRDDRDRDLETWTTELSVMSIFGLILTLVASKLLPLA